MLAIGCWLTPGAREGLDHALFNQAQDQMQKNPLARKPDITLIQALVLLGDFAQKHASPEESSQYIGDAVQTALTLKLHIDPREQHSDELDKEIRRRVWWSVYCAESCSAKICGRPLLLPEETLITTKHVSNIHENVRLITPCWNFAKGHGMHVLTCASSSFPAETDNTTIYTGLIQQSSYHRMANTICRRLLSTPVMTPQEVDEAEQMINAWHNSSSFCVQLIDRASRPEWHFIARRRQILYDQSLRLLIHRPLLLQWFKWKSLDSGPAGDKYPAEERCRAKSLKLAQKTISTITDLISNGGYSKLTLAFTL